MGFSTRNTLVSSETDLGPSFEVNLVEYLLPRSILWALFWEFSRLVILPILDPILMILGAILSDIFGEHVGVAGIHVWRFIGDNVIMMMNLKNQNEEQEEESKKRIEEK